MYQATWWDVVKVRGPEDVKYWINVAGNQAWADGLVTGIYVTAGVVSVWLAARWILKRCRR